MRPTTPALVAPLTALLLLVGPAAATAQEAPPSPLLTGTIDGTDGRAVNALLGFDWLDALGRRLDRNGCVQSPACPLRGYGSVLRVNPTLPARGTSDTATATTTWSVQPPPGAARLFLEAYPQNERLRTDEERYGHAMRHSVPLPHGGPLPLRLPVTRCDEGGTVGTLRGTATRGGAPSPLTRVVAWSLEGFDPVTRPVLGWNIGTASADGSFVVPNLVGDQRYQVWVTAADGAVRKAFNVAVPVCGEASVAVSFDEPPAAAAPPAPAAPPPPPPPAPVLPRTVITATESALVEGAAVPGSQVELLAASAPATTPRVVRTTTASPSGLYVFTVRPGTTTTLRVRTGGALGAPAVLHVRSAVRATVTRTGRRTLRVTGRVLPGRSRPVALYLRTGAGGRRLLALGRSRVDGSYAIDRRFVVDGVVDLFVATGRDALNEEGRSGLVRTRIR